jgi:hypothetical protein
MGGRKAILLLEWKYRGLWTVPVRVTCSENIGKMPKKDLYACLVRVTMKCKCGNCGKWCDPKIWTSLNLAKKLGINTNIPLCRDCGLSLVNLFS